MRIKVDCDTNACVEVDSDGEKVIIETTGSMTGRLSMTREEWVAFLLAVKSGEFDLI